MKRYIDGYVLPIPKKNLADYKKMATLGGKMWMKHGALAYFECVIEDPKPNMGPVKIRNFPELAKAKPSDTVIFAYIVYKSKAHRDRVNAKVMNDPAMQDPTLKDKAMPFDPKQMAYGGFESIVGLES